jgi:hypothetical protein
VSFVEVPLSVVDEIGHRSCKLVRVREQDSYYATKLAAVAKAQSMGYTDVELFISEEVQACEDIVSELITDDVSICHEHGHHGGDECPMCFPETYDMGWEYDPSVKEAHNRTT